MKVSMEVKRNFVLERITGQDYWTGLEGRVHRRVLCFILGTVTGQDSMECWTGLHEGFYEGFYEG